MRYHSKNDQINRLEDRVRWLILDRDMWKKCHEEDNERINRLVTAYNTMAKLMADDRNQLVADLGETHKTFTADLVKILTTQILETKYRGDTQ